MELYTFSLQIFLTTCLIFHVSVAILAIEDESDLDTYIVHLEPSDGKAFTHSEELESWYNSFLSLGGKTRIVHTYKNVMKGFAAKLSPHEVQMIQEYEGFVHARRERKLALQTTHSTNFLGLHPDFGLWKHSNYGEGVIIGVVDTGIFPNHPSFNDQEMPPPPPKWKGKCDFNFTACNNKLIGARYFTSGHGTPLDDDGHGTHTTSTAAGSFVPRASSFGQANGIAAGVAPRAHLAVYKVCFDRSYCSESDVLAAMDAAIEDGVDVLSLSLGWHPEAPFPFNAVALGAYSAIQKGIFVSCAATNQGPSHGTLANVAPWILTVGASTIDRKFKVTTVFGNKMEIEGEAVIQPNNFSQNFLPLVHPGKSSLDPNARFCTSLSGVDVEGKIVVCEQSEAFAVAIGRVEEAGGAGVILINQLTRGVTKLLEYLLLPTIQISYSDGLRIKSYINSTSEPVAKLSFQRTVIGDDHAPSVAFFSSRGPSTQSPGILKPDIIGPGVNILAAWPVSLEGNELRFLLGSGTSMACPHLSGVAALIKSVHQNWSPAAIKSAIMTTADTVNLANNPIEDQTLSPADFFATGAGQVNPSKAAEPGLVYDVEPDDYIPYLCGLQYTDREVGIITQQKVNCSRVSSIPELQLNYPSFSIIFGSRVQTCTRTVINVGEPNSSYVVKISAPPGVDVAVKPNKLDFSKLKQKLTYELTFTRQLLNASNSNFTQGFLTWTSSKHLVRSPIVALMDDWEVIGNV
ncbi:hypothetical protein ACS0TY_004467 [Phlomoides rotata]